MHNKCRGLYGNLTPSKSHDFGLYVCYDLFCLHVEALQMIQPGQPKSDRDRLPHRGKSCTLIYIPYSLEQCLGSLMFHTF